MIESCSICSQIADKEWAAQKYGWEENDTWLPAISSSIKVVRELKPPSSRTTQLWQCPLCSTYYLYETDYEYLVNGTEDTQTLTRLKPGQADAYLFHGSG